MVRKCTGGGGFELVVQNLHWEHVGGPYISKANNNDDFQCIRTSRSYIGLSTFYRRGILFWKSALELIVPLSSSNFCRCPIISIELRDAITLPKQLNAMLISPDSASCEVVVGLLLSPQRRGTHSSHTSQTPCSF